MGIIRNGTTRRTGALDGDRTSGINVCVEGDQTVTLKIKICQKVSEKWAIHYSERLRESFNLRNTRNILRTPPKNGTAGRFNILPSGAPSAATSDDELDRLSVGDEEEPPKPPNTNFGELDTLTNEEIYKHIQLLQLLLQKRGFLNNPRNLTTEFNFTPADANTANTSSKPASPMEAECSFSSSSTTVEKSVSRKRQASSSGRIIVEAQVHSTAQTQGGSTSLIEGDHPRSVLTPKRVCKSRSSADPLLAPAAPIHGRRPSEDLNKIAIVNSQSEQRSRGPQSRRFPPLPPRTTEAPSCPSVSSLPAPSADQAQLGQAIPPPKDKIPPIVHRPSVPASAEHCGWD
ncbi:hypothetical protein QE152_g13464 [Popillia japonica]|uniref:Uncharacterized protein n=1 Tax=Popillia japonica TaxID=7064 RepID=A0AAW1LDA3_POPJA